MMGELERPCRENGWRYVVGDSTKLYVYWAKHCNKETKHLEENFEVSTEIKCSM
jgi:hypothetical protein